MRDFAGFCKLVQGIVPYLISRGWQDAEWHQGYHPSQNYHWCQAPCGGVGAPGEISIHLNGSSTMLTEFLYIVHIFSTLCLQCFHIVRILLMLPTVLMGWPCNWWQIVVLWHLLWLQFRLQSVKRENMKYFDIHPWAIEYTVRLSCGAICSREGSLVAALTD